MKFSIGYNHDIRLLELLDIYKDNIEALYFPIPQRYLGSGRYIPPKKDYLNEVPELIKKCKRLNIKSQLLLNATCEGASGLEKKFFARIIDYVKKLKELGLASLIVTNPVYISALKREIKEIIVESSVNCYVKTVEQAAYLKDLGVDILTVDRDINRNIALIKQIKGKTGLPVKIMLNEGCLRNCPFRNMHYNYISHLAAHPTRPIEGIFPDKFCISIYQKSPAKILNIPFIPPDGLKYYAGFIDYYKLSTRAFTTPQIESCLKAYRDQDFSGNLLEILDSPGLAYFNFIDYPALKRNHFFEKMISCTGNCTRCNYCNKLMEEAVVVNSDFLPGAAQKRKQDRRTVQVGRELLKTSQDKFSIYLKLIGAHLNLKEYQAVIRILNKTINLDYQGENPHLFRGLCYKKARQYKRALEEFKQAERSKPELAEINFSLSACYRNLGQIKLANQELDKGLVKVKNVNYSK